MKTRNDFIKHVGREPKFDDLERVNCKHKGTDGHKQCGWCDKCQLPFFECGCWLKKTSYE